MLKPFLKLKAKVDALRFGHKSEKLAARKMVASGYKIIETNYRCRAGEIDIIAREGDILVFCEVKARKSRSYGSPLEGITDAKIKKIRKAAEHYMKKKGLTQTDCRFDAITVEEKDSATVVEIIPNAF